MATIPTNLPELDEKQIDQPLPDTELAYAAGIVDGEGCIHIKKQRSKTKYGGISVSCMVKVTVANTKPELSQWFKSRWGGHIRKPHAAKIEYKPCYTWELANSKAVKFVRSIYPFLVIKRNQASVAMELQDFIDANRHRPSLDRIEIQSQFKVRMGILNRKGVQIQ